MGTQIGLTFLFLVVFLLLLVFVELVYRRLKLPGEVTRKLAHLTATLSTITFPYLFTDHWYVLFLAVVFFFLLFASRGTAHLRSIHDIARISAGSYLLPVAIYISFLVYTLTGDRFLFVVPMLVLAISDPVAGLLGLNITRFNHQIVLFGRPMGKTWLGSSAFFISAFLIGLIAHYYIRQQFDLQSLGYSLLLALTATLAELFSPRGTDNLSIPLSVLLVLLLIG
jgi:dolichol kinase